MAKTHYIILAAGNGTRMKSSVPKVLHPLGHFPLVGHVISSVQQAQKTSQNSHIHMVLSASSEDVRGFISSLDIPVSVVAQTEQLGTAHAVDCVAKQAADVIAPHDRIVILFGDTPLIAAQTIMDLESKLGDYDMVVGGMTPPDPKFYGRLIVDDENHLDRIVEYKHASDAEKQIGLCNSGIMAFQAAALKTALSEIEKQPETGEYYLTDAVAVLNAKGAKIGFVHIDYQEAEGVNTQNDLALAESRFQNRRRDHFLTRGVRMEDPSTVYFSFDTQIGSDVIIEPNVYFGPRVVIESHCHIRAFSHIEGAYIKESAVIGPFARLRPGTKLDQDVHVGNFVEVKNASFGSGSRLKHLTYVGDATIGERVNLGAGTIVCSYDGYQKHQTKIGDDVFIGSNSSLVAPLEIGSGAMTAAGSTVTKSIEDDAMAVARAPQKNLSGKAKLYREKKQQENITKAG